MIRLVLALAGVWLITSTVRGMVALRRATLALRDERVDG